MGTFVFAAEGRRSRGAEICSGWECLHVEYFRPTLKNLVALPGRRSGPIGCVSRLPVMFQ
jgi:hypothetical protein